MADGIIQVPPDSTGKKIDTEELSVGGNTVERQRLQITGNAAAAVARVLNTVPALTDYGLVVRPVPDLVAASTTAIASGAAANTIIKASAGRLFRVMVTTQNTNQMNIFDNSSSGTGTIIGLIPANADVGSVFEFAMPAVNGITVLGNAANPGVTISWS